METTNGMYNKSMYDAIHPRCALTWQRVQVSTKSGQAAFALASSYYVNHARML